MYNKNFIKLQLIGFILIVGFFYIADAQAAGLVLGVAGAAVGSLFGPVGAQIGWMVGAMLGNMLFQKGKNTEGPRLNDLKVQTNTVGVAIADVWGTVCGSGNIIWCPGFTEHKHEEKQGKGGPTNTYTSYTYTVNVAIGLCAGEIYGIRRIWANEKLVYDNSSGNEGAQGEFKNYMRIYKGTEEQMPDPLIQQFQKDQTPAYRGLAYVVIQDLPLENYGNQIPSMKFEIIRTPDDVGLNKFAIKKVTGTFSGNNYSYAYLHINQGNNYIYRTGNLLGGKGEIIERINPYNYKIEKTTITDSQNTIVSNIVSLSNGSMIRLCRDSKQNILINVISAETVNQTYIDVRDGCTFENGVWIGPFSDILNYNLFNDTNFAINSAPGTSEATFVCVKNDRYFYGTLNQYSCTAKEVKLDVYSTYTIDKATAISKNGRMYFWMNGPNGTNLYLAGVSSPVLLSNIDPYGSIIGDIFFDDMKQNIIIITVNGLILFVDSNKYNIIKTYDTKDSGIYGFNNFNNDTRVLYFNRVDSTGGDYKYYNYSFVELNIDDYNKTETKFNPTDYNPPAYPISDYSRPLYNKLNDHYIYECNYNDGQYSPKYIVNLGSRYDFGTYPLPEVVKELCLKTGLTLDKLDVTDLNGVAVRGFVRANRTTCRSMLEMLSTIYNFDAVESNGKIKFIKRGKASVAEIPFTELGAEIYNPNQPAQNILKSQRTQEIDLPKLANVLYFDREKNYEQNTQESRRVIDTTENVYTLETPAVLVPNEAKQIIDRVMYQTWTARDKYQFTTNMDYAEIEPTDVIKINKENLTYTLRITKKDESQGVCKFEAEAEDRTVYDQNGQGGGGDKPDDDIINRSGTGLILLDLPIFDKSDNNSGVYAVFDKTDPSGKWGGAVILKSQTINGQYQQIDGGGAYSTIGGTLDTLSNWNGKNIINYDEYVTVNLSNGELESISEEDLLNGGNLCVIGNEILQFKEAELIDTNTYRLSGLLRARYGTEKWANKHNNSEQFILLEFNQGKILRINKNDSMFGVEKYYKAVTIGNRIADSSITSFINNGIGYKPLAVDNVSFNKDYNNNYYFEFDYKGRGLITFDDTIPEDIDGALNFEVDIYDDNKNIVRTIKTNINNFSYTAEQQIEDFGNIVNKIELSIYKTNGIIGRGFEYRGTF